MQNRKPTVAEIQRAVSSVPIAGLRGARSTMVSARNHLVYRLDGPDGVFALRMINPESYRAGEWIDMAEEWRLLKFLEPSGLGPKVYALPNVCTSGGETHPALIQEFVEAPCFNDLKPLAAGHLRAVAQAIALLNAQAVTPRELPFIVKYIRDDYAGSGGVWYLRLADALRRLPRRDVLQWVLRIAPLIRPVMAALSRSRPLLPRDRRTFHFDGAHCGNTYWRDGRVIFLDWQKVSLRNDPTFTLVRFATSIHEAGIIWESELEAMADAYLECRPTPNFSALVRARLLERQMADLVWVIWNHARRRGSEPVEESVEAATGVIARYSALRSKLRRERA